MENVTDALKMAFAVMVFTIALTVCMSMLTLVRATSNAVLYSVDKTNFQQYSVEEIQNNTRIVGIDTIIANLYLYAKGENYAILFFIDADTPMPIFNGRTDTSNRKWNIKYTNDPNEEIPTLIDTHYLYPVANSLNDVFYFDLNDENQRLGTYDNPGSESWTGSTQDRYNMLDIFISGKNSKVYQKNTAYNPVTFAFSLYDYRNSSFTEEITEFEFGGTKIYEEGFEGDADHILYTYNVQTMKVIKYTLR